MVGVSFVGRATDLWQRIARIFQAESVGDAVEKSKKRSDVDSFGDLRIGPAGGTERLRVIGRDAIGGFRHQLDESQKCAFGLRQRSAFDVAAAECFGSTIVGPLQLQEECV